MASKTKVFFLALLAISCSPKETETPTFITFPGGNKTSLPYLFANEQSVMLSWVKMIDDTTAQLNYTRLEGEQWASPKEVVKGSDWFVNWADFPAITENNGNLLTHFLRKSSDAKFAYDVKLNVLPVGASEWTTGLPLHSDTIKSEHGFVSAVPIGEKSFFSAWLDGRNTAGTMDHGHSGHSGSMSIRVAEVGFDGTVQNEALLDAKTCDCCQTSVAITDFGPIVVYRDRSDEEVRDISISRKVNGLWTEPKSVFSDGWEINGCPVNGPKVDALGNDVVVAWFTAVNEQPRVKVAFSKDGGEQFGSPIVLSGLETLGRVDVAMIDQGQAVVSWMETENGSTFLKAVKVYKSGKTTEPIVISKMDAARKSGFPQMELSGDRLYFAWTGIQGDESSINTAYINLKSF